MKLSNERHESVLRSPVGQIVDKLIRDEVARGGKVAAPGGGMSIMQALWHEFTKPIACSETFPSMAAETVFDAKSKTV